MTPRSPFSASANSRPTMAALVSDADGGRALVVPVGAIGHEVVGAAVDQGVDLGVGRRGAEDGLVGLARGVEQRQVAIGRGEGLTLAVATQIDGEIDVAVLDRRGCRRRSPSR
jgi:hypothetical protein